MKKQDTKKFILAILLIISCFLTLVACKDETNAEEDLPARYGSWGRLKAIELATSFPERLAGSEQEKAAADWLIKEIETLGYHPLKQDFNTTEANGNSISSQNIVVEINGSGFSYLSESEQNKDGGILYQDNPIDKVAFAAVVNSENTKQESSHLESRGNEAGGNSNPQEDNTAQKENQINQKVLIFTAHYDTPKKTKQVTTYQSQIATPDGIHNNAAAVSSLLTLARQMRELPPGYQVKIIFLGASEANHAGAEAYLQSLSQAELDNIDAVYNLERIYAGDKVYAHAGVNSLMPGNQKSYAMRQKLYELTDVYYNNLLLTNNNFALYTNQNTFEVESPINGELNLFREWTTTEGDHTPFDRAGLPIVFIESYEYDVKNYSELGKETTDPNFSASNGIIDRTNMDSSEILNSYFEASEMEEDEQIFGTSPSETNPDQETETSSTIKDEQGNISLENLRQNKNIDRLERRINNVAFLLLEASRYAGSDFQLK